MSQARVFDLPEEPFEPHAVPTSPRRGPLGRLRVVVAGLEPVIAGSILTVMHHGPIGLVVRYAVDRRIAHRASDTP